MLSYDITGMLIKKLIRISNKFSKINNNFTSLELEQFVIEKINLGWQRFQYTHEYLLLTYFISSETYFLLDWK